MKRLQVNSLRLLVIGILCLVASSTLHAQCAVPAGFVCITQADADKISKDLAELKDSRAAIAQFKAERVLTDAQAAAANTFIKASGDLVAALQKQVKDQIDINQLQAKLVESALALADKALAQLNKPKSGFQKFAQAIEKILYIAAGVAFGRGL